MFGTQILVVVMRRIFSLMETSCRHSDFVLLIMNYIDRSPYRE